MLQVRFTGVSRNHTENLWLVARRTGFESRLVRERPIPDQRRYDFEQPRAAERAAEHHDRRRPTPLPLDIKAGEETSSPAS